MLKPISIQITVSPSREPDRNWSFLYTAHVLPIFNWQTRAIWQAKNYVSSCTNLKENTIVFYPRAGEFHSFFPVAAYKFDYTILTDSTKDSSIDA